MRTVFSTRDVHPRDRFDYWHQVACRQLVLHESVPVSRLDFHADMEAGALDDIELGQFEASAMGVWRTQPQATQQADDPLLVCGQLSGRMALEQEGSEALLEPGDFALLEPVTPYSATLLSRSRVVVAKVPRSEFEARVGLARKFAARRIGPGHAGGRLAFSMLTMLPSQDGLLAPAAQAITKEFVLDLVALALTTGTGAARAKLSSPRLLVSLNLRALTDPNLDSATAAAAAGVSARYANAVLSREGTSLRRLIQTRRLERCRKALEDPRQMHRTVSEIAYGWGFSDMTHFTRSFKAAYGFLPSEHRRLFAQRHATEEA